MKTTTFKDYDYYPYMVISIKDNEHSYTRDLPSYINLKYFKNKSLFLYFMVLFDMFYKIKYEYSHKSHYIRKIEKYYIKKLLNGEFNNETTRF